MHFEVERRLPEELLPELEADVARVLRDVRLCVRDFHAMADRVQRMIEFAEVATARYDKQEVAETVAFLHWLTADNYVFLATGSTPSRARATTRWLRSFPAPDWASCRTRTPRASPSPRSSRELRPGLRERTLDGPLVVVSKTNRESTVHRRVKMDYVGVKRVDGEGRVVGELRLLGLFTSKAYSEPARDIPLVRRKLEYIMESEDLFPGSHDYKAVVSIFESFPKDELFAAGEEDLRATVMALLGLEEKRHVQLFVRPDLRGPKRLGDRRAAPRSRLHRASRAAPEPARGALQRRVGGLPPLVRRDRPGPLPLHRARSRGPDPGRLVRRAGAGGDRGRPHLGRRALRRAGREARRRPGARAGAPLRGPVPRLLQVGVADLHGRVRRRAVRDAGRGSALRGGAAERAGHGRAADAV